MRLPFFNFKDPKPVDPFPKILILGHGRHGKDAMADVLFDAYGIEGISSSLFAAKKFLYDLLKGEMGYKNFVDCYEDRHNHRARWYEEIKKYNTPDRSRLAREMMEEHHIYVGLRDDQEIQACIDEGVFDLIVGVDRPDFPRESMSSFPAQVYMKQQCDFIVYNSGSLVEYEQKIIRIFDRILL